MTIFQKGFSPDKPYNDLPFLPPNAEIETKPILRKVASAGRQLAELNGLVHSLPNPTILVNSVTLQEARASSEIENILTTNDRLFKAFTAKSEQIDPQTKEVLNYREAVWHGFNKLRKRPVFTTNLFIELVGIIKHNESGIRRTPGTRVGTASGKTIYTPPEGEQVIRDKLKNLEDFLHDTTSGLDPLIKLALMHYQFEAIHPFTDGNGRTGRIMNVLFLTFSGLLELPILYLSGHIIRTKQEYYSHIRKVTENGTWEPWILYMLDVVEQTAKSTRNKVNEIRNEFDKTLTLAREKLPAYMYSKELIELLFEQPYSKIEFLVAKGLTKRQRASVYLRTLENIGILKGKKVGKEHLFLNTRLYELLTRWD
jgi:Fic family protein